VSWGNLPVPPEPFPESAFADERSPLGRGVAAPPLVFGLPCPC
jgi:hypothetical protein